MKREIAALKGQVGVLKPLPEEDQEATLFFLTHLLLVEC